MHFFVMSKKNTQRVVARVYGVEVLKMSYAKHLAAEGIGTALILTAVVGSGIMAERLAGGNQALALLANAIATGASLIALILTFESISGSHFNPLVTLSAVWMGQLAWKKAPGIMVVQFLGAYIGVFIANIMFDLPVYYPSEHIRTGMGQWLSEIVATFGLIIVILGCTRSKPQYTPFAVGAYITGAYWFTASTSFANPAVTLARSASNTFAGIRFIDTPLFMVMQILGSFLAVRLFKWFNHKEIKESVIL